MFAVKIMNINQRYQRFMKFQLKNKKLSMAAVFFNLWLSLFTSPPAACVSRWPIWPCWGQDTWGLWDPYFLLLGLVSPVVVAQDGRLARWGEARVQLFCWTWLQAAPAFPAKSTSLSSLLLCLYKPCRLSLASARASCSVISSSAFCPKQPSARWTIL